MIAIEFLTTKPHRANAIDKRAIEHLRHYIEPEIDFKNLNISKAELIDESNYIIVGVEGYENIAFLDPKSKKICETIQPIDRKNNKLFPIQKIEITAQYKRY